MDGTRLDRLARSVSHVLARRHVVHGLAATALGGLAVTGPTSVTARHKASQPNPFGCRNAGQKCRGKDSKCCSGVCQGKKPKHGKKDKSSCADHNAGICTPQLDLCTTGMITTCGFLCSCVLTTGKAGFCGNFANVDNPCRVCAKDTDCQAEFGPGAACVYLGGECAGELCPTTGNTACLPACV
jgi:hypothetical protein